MKLKRLADQVVVVVGASSGIGRETSLRLARAGAAVVVIARGEEHLLTLVSEITRSGGTARHVVCDVTDLAQLQHAADLAESWFGRIDTWVHSASVLLVGGYLQTTPDEYRRVMEINFIGQVNGARVAVPALQRADGGAFISVTSAESYFTLPFHSAYAASKHAVEGFMDGLRRELIAEGAPLSITTIKPAVVDTPIYRVARNHLPTIARAPRPFYDATVVARCIVYAAEHPVRTLYAGGAARLISVLQAVAPRAVDAVFGTLGLGLMAGDAPVPHPEGNLQTSLATGRIRGGLPRPGRRVSLYTWLALRPRLRWAAMAAVATAVAGTLLLRQRRR